MKNLSQKMSWYIVICAGLFTVNIFGNGLSYGSELPVEEIAETAKGLPEVHQFDLSLSRFIRAAEDENKDKMEDLPMEIVKQIMASLELLKTNMSEADLVFRFWCRINVTKLSDIDEKVILEAVNQMNVEVTTCPLEKEKALIEPLIRMLAQGKIPTVKQIIVMINNTMHHLISPEDIANMKNSTEGIIFVVMEKMVNYFNNNPKNTIFKMFGGLLCTLDQIDLTKLSESTLMDIINSIDKNKCSVQQQRSILEKYVKMISIRRWLNPENIFSFIKSNTFRMIAKIIEVPDKEMTAFLAAVEMVDKIKLVDWTIVDLGERFLCHLDKTNISEIDDKVLLATMPKMLLKPDCTQSVLKEKREKLIASVGDLIKGQLLPQMDEGAKEFNGWPEKVMADLRQVDWTEVRIEILKVVKEIDNIAETVIQNVLTSKERKRTVKGMVKNFVCGLNITDFTKIDEEFPLRMLGTIGKLDMCTEAQRDRAWDDYFKAAAKINAWNIMMGLNELNDTISVSDILQYVKDEHIQSIQAAIRSILKVKELETLLETVWNNMKQNPNQKLSVDYILRFMACNVKTADIPKLDPQKVMDIAAKFGKPVTCKEPTNEEWLKDFLYLMMKLQSDMGIDQLDDLDKLMGSFTTKHLKDIASKAKTLKDSAIASLNKVAKKSDEWIDYMEKNGTINISTLGRHLVCFFKKADFSSFEKAITSLGEFGQCTEDESKKLTEDFLNVLVKMDEGELLKEFLLGMGILSGKFDSQKMQDFITKLAGKMNGFLEKIWAMIPKELKELSIAKVMSMIGNGLAPLDEFLNCVVRSVAWPMFGQPNGPDFVGCFAKLFGPYKKPVVNPGKKPGGKLEDRYKVGEDFPFMKMLEDKESPENLLKSLLYFTREPNTDKEGRILDFVTKKVISYLLANQKKLDEYLTNNKKRILELAAKVGRGARMMSRMKVDSESLSMVKEIATPQQARKLLRKAMVDMDMEKKTATEKKDFIEKLPSDMMMKSGTQLIDKFFSEETKKVFIQSFRRKTKPKKSKAKMEDDEEEEEQSLAKLSLVNKLMDKASDNETLSLMMNTTLVSVVSINMLKRLPQKEMCSMKAETSELKEDQIQYLVNSCPKAVEDIAKANATSLGKVATKVTKKIVDSLKLDQLISLTSVACKYERKLDIDLGKVFKDHYIKEKLDPMKNGPNMFCVLKYVKTDLPWDKPEAVEVCKTLGSSLMRKIAPKRAEFFKSECIDLLKTENITFADMGTMNAFLKKADIESLKPETVLQGAVELAGYVKDASVFNEIGKKLASLSSFQKRSNLTADEVAQAGIFIAAWSDADKIPKESVMQNFDSLASGVNLLQKRKLQCLRKGGEKSKCNAMDNLIANTVQILIKATITTSSRRKRSTVSCRCDNLVSLGVAAVQVPATQMADMICDTDFDECMEGLSQITDWNQDHRAVFVQKASKVWGEPQSWNSSNVAIASAAIPGLSSDNIKVLKLDSMDATFYLGKQNNWGSTELTETFVLFVKNLKSNNFSAITSFDLQALGNIVCGISADNIQLIPKSSYINAASQVGSLVCSEAQLSAWAKKALEVYGTDVNTWGLAEISSIGSVIGGFTTQDLQKLSEKQIAAIGANTIPKILPEKLSNLHPAQIGYLTTSQVQMVTSAQKAKMTQEQKDILNKKVLGSDVTDQNNSGEPRFRVSSYFQWSIQLLIYGISVWFLN